jgi:hypothetical protein
MKQQGKNMKNRSKMMTKFLFCISTFGLGWFAFDVNVPDIRLSILDSHHDFDRSYYGLVTSRNVAHDEDFIYYIPSLFGVEYIHERRNLYLGFANTRKNVYYSYAWSTLGEDALEERHRKLELGYLDFKLFGHMEIYPNETSD